MPPPGGSDPYPGARLAARAPAGTKAVGTGTGGERRQPDHPVADRGRGEVPSGGEPLEAGRATTYVSPGMLCSQPPSASTGTEPSRSPARTRAVDHRRRRPPGRGFGLRRPGLGLTRHCIEAPRASRRLDPRRSTIDRAPGPRRAAGAGVGYPSPRLEPAPGTIRARIPKATASPRRGLDQPAGRGCDYPACSVNSDRCCLNVVDRFRLLTIQARPSSSSPRAISQGSRRPRSRLRRALATQHRDRTLGSPTSLRPVRGADAESCPRLLPSPAMRAPSKLPYPSWTFLTTNLRARTIPVPEQGTSCSRSKEQVLRPTGEAT